MAAGTDDDAAPAPGFGRILQRFRADSGGLVWAVRDWNVGVAAEVSGLEPARPDTFAWANFAGARLG